MSSYGRTLLNNTGRIVQVTSDGRPEFKTGGLTVDWNTVAPVAGAPVTLPDDVTVPIGGSYLRYGQVLTMITATGKYGPYDPTAGDGRQLLVRGNVFIVNVTTTQNPISGVGSTTSDHPQVIEGGKMWRKRILAIDAANGAHSLANGPLFTELEAALPRMRYTIDQ